MGELEIRITSPDDVRKIVAINEEQDFDIDAYSGRYVVDGKSLLGMYSLNLSEPVILRTHAWNEQKFRRYRKAIKEVLEIT